MCVCVLTDPGQLCVFIVLNCTHACKYLSSDPGLKCLASAYNLSGRVCVCGGGGSKTLAQATQDIKNDLCAYRVNPCLLYRTPRNNPASGFCWCSPVLLFPLVLLSCSNDGEEADTVQGESVASCSSAQNLYSNSALLCCLSPLNRICELWRFSLQRCQSIWNIVAPHNSRKWNPSAIIFPCSRWHPGMDADLVKWAICLLKQLNPIDWVAALLAVNIYNT